MLNSFAIFKPITSVDVINSNFAHSVYGVIESRAELAAFLFPVALISG